MLDYVTRFFSHFLRSQQDDSDSERKTLRIGYGVIFMVFGLFGTWAVLAPLGSSANASGTVQVEGNTKQVQHLEGGIVSKILVANGDSVSVNQPLILLDTTEAMAELRIVEGRLWAQQALLDRLISERDDHLQVSFSSYLIETEDTRAQQAMASQATIFAARRADILGEADVLEQRIAQLEQQQLGLTSVKAAKRTVIDSMNSEAADLAGLLEEGYVDKQRLRALERSIASELGALSDLDAKSASLSVAISETRLKIVQVEKRYKLQVVDELNRAQDGLFDLQQRHQVIKDRVERSVIKAPISGTVLSLKPNITGAVVNPRQELLSIVPEGGRFVISARLSPQDIDRVHLNQEAEVKFSLFKDAYSVTGHLVLISADALVDSVTGASYYDVKVELLAEDLKFLDAYTLVPGMPAQVMIRTGTRTLLSYIVSPLEHLFSNAMTED